MFSNNWKSGMGMMKSIKVNKEQKLKQESHAFNPTNLKTISKFVF